MRLARLVLRRLGAGGAAIAGAAVLTFLLLHLVPGDPVDHLTGGEATPAQRALLERCLGLDRGLPAQLAAFAGHVVDGTLGVQCPDPAGKPTVAARLAAALPHTVALAVAALAVAVLLALPLGVLAALRRGTWVDALAGALAVAGVAVPMMLLAPALLWLGFVRLGWLPGPTATGAAALVLPALALGAHLTALLARMTRAQLLEVLGEDYLRTARAKGLAERVVIVRHALRNALVPVITAAGMQLGALLSGAVVVEKVFARPGLGHTLLDAIAERNYPVVQGAVLVTAALYVAVGIAVDVAHAVVDPRLRPR